MVHYRVVFDEPPPYVIRVPARGASPFYHMDREAVCSALFMQWYSM
jgi:hypothetical protein